jgi:hypothetical protein
MATFVLKFLWAANLNMELLTLTLKFLAWIRWNQMLNERTPKLSNIK